MEVTGTTQIGVVDDSAGAGGRSGRLVVGDERGDALASQAANLDGASRYSLGTLTMEISIKAQDAQTRSEALLGMRSACQDGDDQSFGVRPD